MLYLLESSFSVVLFADVSNGRVGRAREEFKWRCPPPDAGEVRVLQIIAPSIETSTSCYLRTLHHPCKCRRFVEWELRLTIIMVILITVICVQHPCKSHDHDQQWIDAVMTWLPQNKGNHEHKGVKLVWDFGCSHLAQYISISPHDIEYKHILGRMNWVSWLNPLIYILICVTQSEIITSNPKLGWLDCLATLFTIITYTVHFIGFNRFTLNIV